MKIELHSFLLFSEPLLSSFHVFGNGIVLQKVAAFPGVEAISVI